MISRQQDIRHFPATKLSRPRVLRSLQQTGGETVVGRRFLVTQNSSQQASDGIDDDHGGNGSVREDVITDRDFRVGEVFGPR